MKWLSNRCDNQNVVDGNSGVNAMGIRVCLWEKTSFLLGFINFFLPIESLKTLRWKMATNTTPSTLIRASDAIGESLRVSGVLSCGICCSQALWGARSLQHYRMQSQKSPPSFAHLVKRGYWPKIVVKRTPSGPLPVSVQGLAAGELEQHWFTYLLNYFLTDA